MATKEFLVLVIFLMLGIGVSRSHHILDAKLVRYKKQWRFVAMIFSKACLNKCLVTRPGGCTLGAAFQICRHMLNVETFLLK